MTVVYKNPAHQKIYKSFILLSTFKYSNDFLAAAFLLSADRSLWSRARNAISGNEIDFDAIDEHDLSTYAYTLLKIAQDIYEGTQHFDLKDFGDPFITSNKTFLLFTEALRIMREGYETLGITKRFN